MWASGLSEAGGSNKGYIVYIIRYLRTGSKELFHRMLKKKREPKTSNNT